MEDLIYDAATVIFDFKHNPLLWNLNDLTDYNNVIVYLEQSKQYWGFQWDIFRPTFCDV